MSTREAIDAYTDAHTTATPPELAALEAEARATLPSTSMLSGHVVGRLLETLVTLARPRLVLEIGTYAGLSALWMARALPAGGRLITCELSGEFADFAQGWFDRTPGGERIDLRRGPALETIASLDEPLDLVFVDADKTGYPAYLDAVLPKLADGGMVVCDNMLRSGHVLDGHDAADEGTRAIHALNERVAADPGLVGTLLTVRDGLLLIRRA